MDIETWPALEHKGLLSTRWLATAIQMHDDIHGISAMDGGFSPFDTVKRQRPAKVSVPLRTRLLAWVAYLSVGLAVFLLL